MELCLPAKIYMIITIICTVIHSIYVLGEDISLHKKVSVYLCQMLYLMVQIVCICLWCYLLNWLCTNGHTTVAWVLFLFPLILKALMVLFIIPIMIIAVDKSKRQHDLMQEVRNTIGHGFNDIQRDL